MPQLFSRMDDLNWLTPSIADILDQGAPPPGGDGSMRELVAELQDEFAALETPAKIVNVRPTPSYTLFLLQPETVGRLTNRRTITPAEIRRSIGQIAEKHKEWRLGFMQVVDDAPDNVGLLLRTDKHRPLSLRRLLIRGTFRDYASSLAFTLGNTLDQRLIVRDLELTPHLLLIGESPARQHIISSLLMTLILLNTPGELRTVLAGPGGETYKDLTQTPHAMSAYLTDPEALVQMLQKLTGEAQSRLDRFYEEGVNQFQSYNARLRDQSKPGLPRIVVALDPLTDATLQPALEHLTPMIHDLLVNGAQVGIHLIIAINQVADLPPELDGLFPTRIFMRSAAPDPGDKVRNWHNSLLRFIDAFIIESGDQEITPVELCAVSPAEIRGTVEYWQGVVTQRRQEQQETTGRRGGTGLLTAPGSPNLPDLLQRAGLLAAYLGWLSTGALRDIFGISESEAHGIIQQLQAGGVLENTAGAMLRFVRLAEYPLPER